MLMFDSCVLNERAISTAILAAVPSAARDVLRKSSNSSLILAWRIMYS